MRRLHRTVVCALGALAPAGAALALPTPPYAADPALAGAPGFDRYGGGARAPDPVPRAERPALDWAGKTAAPVFVLAPPAPVPAATPIPFEGDQQPPPPTERAAARTDEGQYVSGWNGSGQNAAPQNASPQNASPKMAPPRIASGRNASVGGPRFYSVHRDYGIEPDPIPLAPQFFGPTADLSEPPPPLRRTPLRGQTGDAGSPQ